MTVTPNNPFDVTSKMRTFISNAPSFQTLTGAADATAALEFLYMISVDDDDLDADEIFCVIGDGGDLRIDKTSEGVWETNGTVNVAFDFPVAVANRDSESDAFAKFTNDVWDICEYIFSNVGPAQFQLLITGASVINGPARSEPMERRDKRDSYQMILAFDYHT